MILIRFNEDLRELKPPNCMKFEDLQELLFSNLNKIIKNHESLAIFASNRSKFEGWLKVELIQILKNHGCKDVLPEKERIDITFDNWALELKTCNTSYRYKGIVNKTRTITTNIQEILNDVESLKKTTYDNKAVFFIVFPLESEKREWKQHIDKISKNCKDTKYLQFQFANNISGVMYMCLI